MFIVKTQNKEYHIDDRVQITISQSQDKEFYRLQLLFENEYGKDDAFLTENYQTHRQAEFAKKLWLAYIRSEEFENMPIELEIIEKAIDLAYRVIERLHNEK